jgi:hypothetical protein
MSLFPIKTCVVCGEEFELKPNKPGFANRCPACSEPDEAGSAAGPPAGAIEGSDAVELNAERRRVMRDMLYKKES